ncbi:hypothetical protein SH668x_002455 [Planctomicrobium sp. SH668]|uniref:hypothetical protein n=1 Tax=Planctomicrobium sp. SH668 TaxID=3448126 RepID=UPI003F5BD4F9
MDLCSLLAILSAAAVHRQEGAVGLGLARWRFNETVATHPIARTRRFCEIGIAI